MAAASAAAAPVAACGSSSGGSGDTARAIKEAKAAYAQAVKRGEDLSRGPCIAERLSGLDDWVADVAHDPRLPVDDVAANQCARFRDGEAHHFVELTPSGKLIRTG